MSSVVEFKKKYMKWRILLPIVMTISLPDSKEQLQKLW